MADILLPGRDFHLPAKVGDWSPKELNNYLRQALQNDPSILPQTLKANTISLQQDIIYQGQTIIDVITQNAPASALPGTNDQDALIAAYNNGQLNPNAANLAVAPPFSTTDPFFTFLSFDPTEMNLNAGVTLAIENRIVWGAVAVPYPILARYCGFYFRSSFGSIGPTITQNAYQLYGPWTPATRAAVPSVSGAISTRNTDRSKMETAWCNEYSVDGLAANSGIGFSSPVALLPGVYFVAGIFTFSAGSNLLVGGIGFKTIAGDGGGSAFYTGGDGGGGRGLQHGGPQRAGSYSVAGSATLPGTLDTTTNYTIGLGSTGNDAAIPLAYLK